MEADWTELGAWLRLSLVPGVGPRTARKLLGSLGGPHAIFSATTFDLRKYLTENQCNAVQALPQDWPAPLTQAQEWLRMSDAGEQRAILTLGDARYPQALLDVEDPPLLLYLRGRIDAWLGAQGQIRPGLAVVGSRNPTPQGVANARDLARACAQTGLCIVSGLALGVDSAAHEGALGALEGASCVTLAVVGTGLDRVYPKRNHALARHIEQRGVLVSEYALGTPPLAPNFPRRNRLIAGLSVGTLVVEAALASGSLITARFALEQGKTVFAVPGSIHSPQSRGCHALLREGACLVETVDDIRFELQGQLPPEATQSWVSPPPPSEPERSADTNTLLAHLGWEPQSIDTLAQRTRQPVATLLAALLELELAGLAARLPGSRYQRLSPELRPG